MKVRPPKPQKINLVDNHLVHGSSLLQELCRSCKVMQESLFNKILSAALDYARSMNEAAEREGDGATAAAYLTQHYVTAEFCKNNVEGADKFLEEPPFSPSETLDENGMIDLSIFETKMIEWYAEIQAKSDQVAAEEVAARPPIEE